MRVIFSVHSEPGTVTVLLAKGQLIDGKPVNYLNSVDVDSDGIIYFSQFCDQKDLIKDMMGGRPSGRYIPFSRRHCAQNSLCDIQVKIGFLCRSGTSSSIFVSFKRIN